jgi:ribosome-binding factor A
MSDRIRKINELVREEVSKAIANQIGTEDFITVTAVETSDDLKHSLIWVSVLGDEAKALADLIAHKSAIQHEVTGKMATKYTPKISFRIDHSQEYVEKIDRLLKNDRQ